jgi:hypothetical protein
MLTYAEAGEEESEPHTTSATSTTANGGDKTDKNAKRKWEASVGGEEGGQGLGRDSHTASASHTSAAKAAKKGAPPELQQVCSRDVC